MPQFRIIVANSYVKRDGKFLDYLGMYRPLPEMSVRSSDPSQPLGIKRVSLNFDRAKYWLSVGAQPTPRVLYLFGLAGILPCIPVDSFRASSAQNIACDNPLAAKDA